MTDQITAHGPADWTPDHYRGDGLQPFDVINAFGLDFYEGNAIKYLLRWRKKNGIEDLRKARTYVQVLIDRAEQESTRTLDWIARGTRDLSIPEQTPAADGDACLTHIKGACDGTTQGCVRPTSDDTLRFLRRESLLVLLTRLQRGRTLSEEEAGTLRHHVETEMCEANTAREERDEYARRCGESDAEADIAQHKLEHARAIAHRLAAHAVGFHDVLDESDHGPWGKTVGADIADLVAALDGTEQPTTETVPYTQLRAAYEESWQLIEMQKEFIGKLRRLIMTAITDREDRRVQAESCVHCGRDHMNELYEAIIAADKEYAEAFPATAEGPARPGRLPETGA